MRRGMSPARRPLAAVRVIASAAMRRFPRLLARAVLWGALAIITQCGFVRIHDEAVIGGDGGALARRSVELVGQGSFDRSLDAYAERFLPPEERVRMRRDRQDLRRSMCAALTSMRGGWRQCRYSDSTLVVERRYAAGESPFSSAEIGQVTFALHHWLGNGLTRPEFSYMGVGAIPRDDSNLRATIAGLRAEGYVHDLAIRMPGRIRIAWGTNVRDGGRVVRLDLLEEWPDERETFVVSDADLLHSTWFIVLGVTLFMVAMLVMLRRLEGR